MNRQIPDLQQYLKAAKAVKAINPTHQRAVTKYAEAHRRVDFHVDVASFAADQVDLKLSKIYQKAERKHLALEEQWFDKALEIESELPKRELTNAARQLIKSIQEQETPEITIRVTKEGTTEKEVESYLPSNFRVDATVQSWIIVKGFNNAGWTAEGYVIPRLGSGGIHSVVERNPHERLNDSLYAEGNS